MCLYQTHPSLAQPYLPNSHSFFLSSPSSPTYVASVIPNLFLSALSPIRPATTKRSASFGALSTLSPQQPLSLLYPPLSPPVTKHRDRIGHRRCKEDEARLLPIPATGAAKSMLRRSISRRSSARRARRCEAGARAAPSVGGGATTQRACRCTATAELQRGW